MQLRCVRIGVGGCARLPGSLSPYVSLHLSLQLSCAFVFFGPPLNPFVFVSFCFLFVSFCLLLCGGSVRFLGSLFAFVSRCSLSPFTSLVSLCLSVSLHVVVFSFAFVFFLFVFFSFVCLHSRVVHLRAVRVTLPLSPAHLLAQEISLFNGACLHLNCTGIDFFGSINVILGPPTSQPQAVPQFFSPSSLKNSSKIAGQR